MSSGSQTLPSVVFLEVSSCPLPHGVARDDV